MNTAAPAIVTPTGVVVAPPNLDREQWLAARRTGVGGSDIAAVLGMSKYTSPVELYLDKVGELGDVPRSPELVEAAFWGHQHEPTIASVFAERTGLGVVEGPGMLAHVERPWMLANVDRYVIEQSEATPSSLLEIKTRSAYQLDDWLLGVPDGPALQTHWYLAVTGYSHAHVAALLGGNRLIIHRVERDESLVEHLVDIVGRFWQSVLDRVPPAVDGSEATEELLGHLYKVTPDRVTVVDPAEVLPLLDRRRELKAREQRTADELREVDNRLKAVAGEAEVVKTQGAVAFTWKQNGPLSTKRFAAAHPDLAAKYTHRVDALDTKSIAAELPDEYRVFRARRLVVPKEITTA
ncbi:YqaJ viral recombinase family protein [Streptomyces sp. ASQP_92]|uniref:YqaJ viral recombinase family nuclease n=1 Tax=Streptomyces sp. ASQP_92 TaxID=2979116 RepID=UPI0021BE4605|nr:YqaJ viral recombinase family protein [Streptomyces sp. ASQP_92]MCT9090610.1 YqaJ viral recombinase family protein [Streptomyces sp. ASQP_92]